MNTRHGPSRLCPLQGRRRSGAPQGRGAPPPRSKASPRLQAAGGVRSELHEEAAHLLVHLLRRAVGINARHLGARRIGSGGGWVGDGATACHGAFRCEPKCFLHCIVLPPPASWVASPPPQHAPPRCPSPAAHSPAAPAPLPQPRCPSPAAPAPLPTAPLPQPRRPRPQPRCPSRAAPTLPSAS